MFEVCKGDIVELSCYSQSVLVPGVAEPLMPSTLVIVGPPSDSRGRNAEPRVGLNCRLQCFPCPMAGCAPTYAARICACDPRLLVASTTYHACRTCRCPHDSITTRFPRQAVARAPLHVMPSSLTPINARSRRKSPNTALDVLLGPPGGGAPHGSADLPLCLVGPSLSRSCAADCSASLIPPISDYPGVARSPRLHSLPFRGGTLSWLPFPRLVGIWECVLSSGPGSPSRLAPILLSALATRGPRPDPRDRPRLPLAAGSLTPAPFSVDAVTSEAVEAALNRVKEVSPKRPVHVISPFPAVLLLYVTLRAAPSWSSELQRASVHRRSFSSRLSRRPHWQGGVAEFLLSSSFGFLGTGASGETPIRHHSHSKTPVHGAQQTAVSLSAWHRKTSCGWIPKASNSRL